jgi:hypothetical protein
MHVYGHIIELEFSFGRGDRVAYGGGLEIPFEMSQGVPLRSK